MCFSPVFLLESKAQADRTKSSLCDQATDAVFFFKRSDLPYLPVFAKPAYHSRPGFATRCVFHVQTNFGKD